MLLSPLLPWDAAAVAPVPASRPLRIRAEFSLFSGGAIFGRATIALGLSRSFWLSLVALVILGRDMETVKWVGGFITGIVASLNIGQGIADGFSEGRTSARNGT